MRERLRRILERARHPELLDGLERIVCDLVARHRPVAVYVAGSLARGEFVAGLSDVDVLVVTERPPAKHERFQLAAVGDTDVEITLVSLEEAVRALGEGAGFTAQAIREGVLVYGESVDVKRRRLARP